MSVADKVHRGRRLEVEMRTRATPEAVWEAWADPEKIRGSALSPEWEAPLEGALERLSAALDGHGAAS